MRRNCAENLRTVGLPVRVGLFIEFASHFMLQCSDWNLTTLTAHIIYS